MRHSVSVYILVIYISANIRNKNIAGVSLQLCWGGIARQEVRQLTKVKTH